ncbi:hypothetical protein [Apilactobacillus ozensis]|uniref:hypothetical protein n=1 Tax=Apilactobacillus ozensis TaxID=866801 RepID=UPI00200B2B00|nr:hypothetical protein [Apilactobacillus ozensis]MCK8607245.1 hypothetical protein [Apilactobacillus ozensis]
MNKKGYLTLLVCCIALFALSINTNASGYSYRKLAIKSVITTKSVKIFKGTTGKYEAANKFKYAGHVKVGSHIKVSDYYMSTGGWIIKGGKYNTSGKHFYIVSTDKTHWFK